MGMHMHLIKVCLSAKAYHLAVAHLDADLFEVDPRSVTPADYMSFYYYGGMVYLGLKNFARALHFFRMVSRERLILPRSRSFRSLLLFFVSVCD